MNDVKSIFRIYLIWSFIIFLLFYFGVKFVFPVLEINFFWQFANWDGLHYLPIAEFGYYRMEEYAFFPLYPILIKLLTFITGNYLTSGVVINLLSTFLGVLFFYKLVVLEKNKEIATKALLLLLIFPTSFFFIVVYSESLFFLFSVLSFYFLKKEKILLSVFFSGLATATRPLGLAVAAAVFYQLIILMKRKKSSYINWVKLIGLLFISVSGIIIYMLYLFFETGSVLTFLTAQSNWNRSLGWPWEGLLLNILNIVASPNIWLSLSVVWEFLFAVFGMGIVLRSFRFLPTHYGLYGLVSLLLPLTTSSLMSFPRFLLPIFPIFIVLALTKNRLIYLSYGILSTALLIYFSILFINGFWVS